MEKGLGFFGKCLFVSLGIFIGFLNTFKIGFNLDLLQIIVPEGASKILGTLRVTTIQFLVGFLTSFSISATRDLSYIKKFWADILENPSHTYLLLSGVLGAFSVAGSVIAVNLIGFSLFIVISVGSQLICCVILDSTGCCFANKRINVLNWFTFIGIFILIGGILLINFNDFNDSYSSDATFGMIVSLISGPLIAIQSSFNQKVSRILDSKLSATCISMFSGMLVFSIIFIFSFLYEPLTVNIDHYAIIYSWFGPGVLSFVVVGLGLIYVPSVIGLVQGFCAFICGSNFGALIMDELGLFSKREPATLLRILGVCVVFVGISILTLGRNMEATELPDYDTHSASDAHGDAIEIQNKKHTPEI